MLHYKLHADQATKIFTKIFQKVGAKWDKLIEDLKKAADVDDQSQIGLNKFVSILSKHGVKMKESDKELIGLSLPGKESDDNQEQMINISKIYDQKYTILLDKMYQRVDQ